MSDISNSYVGPGVYVEYQDVSIPAAPNGTLFPVIIGLGQKTITYTETVTRGATTTSPLYDVLSKPSLLSVQSVASRGTVYAATTNYTVDVTNNAILWVSGSAPAAGTDYSVTYTYRKGTADYGPFTTTRMEDIEALYGQAVFSSNLLTSTVSAATTTSISSLIPATVSANQYAGNYLQIKSGTGVGQERLIISHAATTVTSNPVVFVVESLIATPTSGDVIAVNDISTNTLSIGAKLAIQSGAGYVTVVQATDDITGSDSQGTGWEGAIYSLRNIECYAITLMKGMTGDSNSALINYLKNHVLSMSSLLEKKFRIALIGAPVNTVIPATYSATAALLNSNRIALMCPSTMTLTLNNVSKTVDGSFLAACVAGIVCNPNYTWAEPISGKSITPFDDIANPFIVAEQNTIGGSGVMLIEKKNPGDFRIRHALTTDPKNPITQELKVTKIQDALSKYLIASLESTFINTKNVGTDTISNVKAFLKTLLTGVMAPPRQDITGFTDPSVVPSALDPRQINVSFMIQPSWDVNWIKVTFGASI